MKGSRNSTVRTRTIDTDLPWEQLFFLHSRIKYSVDVAAVTHTHTHTHIAWENVQVHLEVGSA